MQRLFTAAVAALVCSGVFSVPQRAAAQAGAAALPELGGGRLLEPIRHKQLTILPVAGPKQPAAPPPGMLTLTDGLARKLVVVREREGGGDVNHVQVTNRSDLPLLLLGGELILGGQQDRIISKEVVVPPRKRATVAVFCVEHGRWSGGRHFGRTGGIVESKVRVSGKYRVNQSEVWSKVRSKAGALGASSATGTYRAIGTSAAGEGAVKPYRDRMTASLNALPERNDLVGLVAAVNGDVTAIDIFDNPALFASYRNQLLDAAIVTAADQPETAAAGRAPTLDEVRRFITRAEAGSTKVVPSGDGARSFEAQDSEVVGSTLELAPTRTAPAKKIYRSYQKNE
jgi:hypothetical protein